MMFMKCIPEATMQNGTEDPRSRSGFLSHYYPSANGKPAPPADSTERNDLIMLEFLAAYYEINREYARLLEVRKEPESPERSAAERERLQAIESVLILRDGLEDRYAPFGVIAEPVVKDGFTVDLKVSFGNVNAAGKLRSELYTITAYVPIPWPKGVKIEDLPIQVEGPGISAE
jgi:hypothetical protein